MAPLKNAIYRRIIQPLVFRLEAETAHRLTLAFLSALPPLPIRADPPELRSTLWGLQFSNPVGLAAGMDKDARAVWAWQWMGLGLAEVGTITPRPQSGNPRPRMWRLARERALINRLGFPSEGMDAVAARIARARRRGLKMRLGLNFGPNKDTPVERIGQDYAALLRRLGALADFVVVNVSSPNTPGLRNWQSPDRMRELFTAINAARSNRRRPPILIKIAPDLDEPMIYSICDTALELGLDGMVVSNTTLKREAVGVTAPYAGGLSGKPLLPIARKLVRDVYLRTRGRIPIIGVGGIANAQDAFGYLRAGASLVELYTGLVYEGPGLVEEIKAGLCDLLRLSGFRSVSEAIGSKAG